MSMALSPEDDDEVIFDEALFNASKWDFNSAGRAPLADDLGSVNEAIENLKLDWPRRALNFDDAVDEWRKAIAPTGEPYFYNRRTRETSWDLPKDAVVVKVGRTEKFYAGNPATRPAPKTSPRVFCVYCGAMSCVSKLPKHLAICPAKAKLSPHVQKHLRAALSASWDDDYEAATPHRVTPTSSTQTASSSSSSAKHKPRRTPNNPYSHHQHHHPQQRAVKHHQRAATRF